MKTIFNISNKIDYNKIFNTKLKNDKEWEII